MNATTPPSLAEICAVACAEAWRGDGEILANPIGTIPTIGARLAASTFEPELLCTDGDSLLVATPIAVGAPADAPKLVEGWLPFGHMFDVVWWGKRHVMMGATQIDRFGNQNIASIGVWQKPRTQLLGVRGAPGNTVNHSTSYWIPDHSTRVFVEKVDCVCGIGYDRAGAGPPSASEFHDIRRVISNLGVFDFASADHSMRIVSTHPGVTVEQVLDKTGFSLVVPEAVPVTRPPTSDELRLIRDVIDPNGLGDREVPSS